MEWISRGVESLIAEFDADCSNKHFDAVVIGSGYGGAVAASRLARCTQPGKDGATRISVCVLERGREYVPGEFPDDVATLPAHVRFTRSREITSSDPAGSTRSFSQTGDPLALFDFRLGSDMGVLVGSALGGTSQINAGVVEEPLPEVFRHKAWPLAIRQVPDFLRHEFAVVREMLGAKPLPETVRLNKTDALESLEPHVAAEAARPGGCFRKPPIAVSFAKGATQADVQGQPIPNKQGVTQRSCISCGDCVTGCNHWAKNTLTMNYLPDAARFGAEIYTRAVVLRVRKTTKEEFDRTRRRWAVIFRCNGPRLDDALREEFRLFADVVVLAAGTLGSTEILMRSRADDLELSSRLGRRFHGNGDMLAAGFDQRDPVHALARSTSGSDNVRPGPTITGMIDLRSGTAPAKGVVIQEGAIPRALYQLAAEALTTTAMLHQFNACRLRSDRPDGRVDPLAVDRQALDHTQIYLAMGHEQCCEQAEDRCGSLDDGAQAERWVQGGGRSDEGWLIPHWPGVGSDAVYEREARMLDRCDGIGGIHLPNPVWRPLPASLQKVLSGPVLQGPLLTVHPLGGCAMGDDVVTGVVDEWGEVFDPLGGRHGGLFVWDGSILPTSVGINPLLTIAALAERCVAHMAADRGWSVAPEISAHPCPLPLVPSLPKRYEAKDDEPIAVRFEERMEGQLVGDPTEFGLPKDGEARKFLLRIDARIGIPDVARMLEDPKRSLKIEADLRCASVPQDRGDCSGVSGDDESLAPAPLEWKLMGKATGTLALMHRHSEWPLSRIVRSFRQWWRTRGHDELCQSIRKFFRGFVGARAANEDGEPGLGGQLRQLPAMIRMWMHTGEQRFMTYRLTFTNEQGTRFVLEGEKRIAYDRGINIWRSVADLALEIRPEGDGNGAALARGIVGLDLVHMIRNCPPQILRQPDAIRGWLAMAGFGLFFLRVLVRTFFFDFRAPNYAEIFDEDLEKRLPGEVDGRPCERHRLAPAAQGQAEGRTYPMCLTRYAAQPLQQPQEQPPEQPGERLPPIVCIHGFAHSSLIFAAPTVKENFVQYATRRGREVWLLDLPTSIGLASCREQWTLDELARHCIRPALEKVREISGAEKVDVVAHCMGSAVFSMAVLSGSLESGDLAAPIVVRRAVLTQVGPFIVGSPSNQLRSELVAFLDGAVGLDHIDLAARKPATQDWLAALADRIAMTYPVPEKELQAHDAHCHSVPRTDIATCNRVTAAFGRNWNHDNLNRETHEALWRYLGWANMTTFRQIVDFVQRRRVVFLEGINSYFHERAIQTHWKFDTCWLHGGSSDVFEPETSLQSCSRVHQVLSGRDRDEKPWSEMPWNYARVSVFRHYGHLDLWLGEKCASEDDEFGVFKAVVEHLSSPAASTQKVAPTQLLVKAPTLGPVLGWVREAVPPNAPPSSAAVYLRVWWQVDDTQSDKPDVGVTLVVRPGEGRDGGVEVLGGFEWEIVSVRQALGGINSDGAPVPRSLTLVCVADLSISSAVFPEDAQIWVGSSHLRTGSFGRGEGAHMGGDTDSVIRPRRVLSMANDAERETLETIRSRFLELGQDHRLCVIRDAAGLRRLAEKGDQVRLWVGSCSYPGTMMEQQLRDRSFGEMIGRIGNHPPDALVLTGDQIYADATAGVLDTTSPRLRVVKRYEAAGRAANLRRIARALPVFTAIDDHEIWDGFEPTHRLDAYGIDARVEAPLPLRRRSMPGAMTWSAYNWARLAYVAYQAGQTPIGRIGSDSLFSTAERRDMSYRFSLRGFGVFVLDTRTQRSPRQFGGEDDYDMFSNDLSNPAVPGRQMDELRRWLLALQRDPAYGARPKFIVTGSVPFPFNREHARDKAYYRRDDGWLGYSASLAALVDQIAEHRIENVVFLTGDYHCSFSVEFHVRSVAGGEPISGKCFVSSPLYAPLPFANAHPSQFLLSTNEESTCTPFVTPAGSRLDYAVKSFCSEDGFMEVVATMGQSGSWVVDGAFIRAAHQESCGVGQARAPQGGKP